MRVDIRLPVVEFFELEFQLKNQLVQLLSAAPALDDVELFAVDHEYFQTLFIEVILDDRLVWREYGTQLSDRHSPLVPQPDKIGIVKLRLSDQFDQCFLASIDLLHHSLV